MKTRAVVAVIVGIGISLLAPPLVSRAVAEKIRIQLPRTDWSMEETYVEVDAPYYHLIEQYRAGETAAAIKGVMALPLDDLQDFVYAQFDNKELIPQLGGPFTEHLAVKMAVVRFRLMPMAAVLHFDAAWALRDKLEAARTHLTIARGLVDWSGWREIQEKILPRQPVLERIGRVRRDILVLIAWELQFIPDFVPLESHLAHARGAIPDDARIWLASGSAEELSVSPELMRERQPSRDVKIPTVSWRRAIRNASLSKAENYYREAITRDPALTEAYLRLGWLLVQRQKWPEATSLLAKAKELATEPYLRYLADLFQAGLAEAQGDTKTATARYTAMVKAWPGCQSPHVGLSQLLLLNGEAPAALAALAPLWSTKQSTCDVDGWWLYDSGQSWRLGATVRALAEFLRSGS